MSRPRKLPSDAVLRHLHGAGGLRVRDIADRYGVNDSTVSRALANAGARDKKRVRGRRDHKLPVDAAALWAAYLECGKVGAELARRYGCTPPAVSRRLRELRADGARAT